VADTSFAALLASLSPDAHIRGKQFERIAKWWLTQDPIRFLDVKQAWLWDEWPERSGPDIGIDIVAEMFDGTLCAIQAKCFDENRDIPKSELDSFVSAASHRTFQHRWLIATTDRLSTNARRMLDDQHVTRIMRSDLEESLDVWPTSIDDLNPIPLIKYLPRPHQQRAITDVVAGLSSNSRGQLIMACGTGKTLTALWIKETLKPRTTLVLVPSLNLLAQTLAEWAKHTSSPWNYLCVCSDDTVNKADDQPISTVGDLPFDVTTDAGQISSFLSLGGEKIIFSTYQSSVQVAKAQELTGIAFDLVICDEAHRLTGKTAADYATVLDEKKIVAEKRLFMTATPRTYTTVTKSKAEERGVEITSMDDEHVYGPVLHKLTFGEAIKQELLSDYRILIVGVTDPQVQDLIERRELVSVNDSVTTDARTLAAHIGLAKATKDYNLKRTISFHSRIKTADQFARDHAKILEWLPESHKPFGETWTGTISGAMNTGDRRKLLNQLRLDGNERHAILTNARCLTEGVDVPSLDGVAFIDPRSSQVDIIQAVGRAIRKSEKKEIGTIVLPVLIPTDSDTEHALEDTAFKPIWAILNALKSHDEELAIELKNLRTELGRTGTTSELPNRLVEDLPTDIDSILPGFSYKLSIALVEQTTSSWEWWIGLLDRYLQEFDSVRIAAKEKYMGASLGYWISEQREQNRLGRLTTERFNILNSFPGWTWDPLEDDWASQFHLLKTYLASSNASYPENPRGSDNSGLGKWIIRQRQRFSKGSMPHTQIEKLESLPNWSWDPLNENWKSSFENLKKFVEREGHARPAANYLENGERLGLWVSQQRNRYKANRVLPNQKKLLESLPGWSWDPLNENWMDLYSACLKLESTNPMIRRGSIPKELLEWMKDQRERHQNGQLSSERVRLLEQLSDWMWNPKTDLWQVIFNEFSKWAESNNPNTVSPEVEFGGASGRSWTDNQRTRYRTGKLTEDQISQLQSIPGWSWHRTGSRWNSNFETLRRLVGESSLEDTNLTADIEEWIRTQRRRQRAGRIPKDEQQKLESLKGWSWIPKSISTPRSSDNQAISTAWMINYQALKRFSETSGTSSPSVSEESEGLKIGKWVSHQRDYFKKGKLSPNKIELLESLAGWIWSVR
jgi:superfamily II DNA or RNA helicase